MFGLNPQPHFLILLLLVLFSHSVQSLRFEVQSGEAKCINEEIRSNAMTFGNYSVVNPNPDQPLPESHKIKARMVSPGGTLNHLGDLVQSGQFAFETVESGTYIICFWGADHNPKVTLSVEFVWKTGVAHKGLTGVAKKRHVDNMTASIQDLVDDVANIHGLMYFLRLRSEKDHEFNWATNQRMFWLSLLSIFVCLSVAGLQLWYLKTFFEKKKII